MHARSPLWIATVAALALVRPGEAQACKPRTPVPLTIPRPTWTAGTDVELVDERIEIECGRGRKRSQRRCQWRSVWVFEGPGGAEVDGVLVIPGQRFDEVELELRVDGTVVEQLVESPDGIAASLHATDSARIEVALALETDVFTQDADHCMWPAGYVRHRFVAATPELALFIVHEGPALANPDAHTQLEVEAPPGWRVNVDHGPDSRERRLSATMQSSRLYRVSLDNRTLAHGPFVAGGVGFGPEIRARLRAGYEIAAPPPVLYSLAVEGDAVEELLIAPAIEAALPSVWGLLPSPGIGVGAPVMLLPVPRAGIRAQWSLAWPIAGLVGSIDIYPQPGKPALRGGLMVQISI